MFRCSCSWEKHVQGICFRHASCPVCHKLVALVSSKSVRKRDLRISSSPIWSKRTSHEVVSRSREFSRTWRIITARREGIYYRLVYLSTDWSFYSFIGVVALKSSIRFFWLQNRLKLFCSHTEATAIKTSKAEKPSRKRAQAAELHFKYI